MKRNYLLYTVLMLTLALSTHVFAQAPQAGFSLSPNPVCAGTVVHVTDLSSGSPTAWSYTLHVGAAGSLTSSVQNPTVAYNAVGVQTITLIASNSSGASAPVTQTVLVLPSPNLMLMPNNASTCPGGSVTLSANTNSANTLLWSNGASTSTIVVSPTATSIYSCMATNTAGCSSTRSVAVTIAQPTVTINGNPGTSCNGSSVTLISNMTGQGPDTYHWSNSATTKTISINVPGVYDVTVTNSSGCLGTRSFTVISTTSLNVTAQSNQSVICAGVNANLIATGASSYSWSTGSTMQVSMVTPSTTTTYTVFGSSSTCTGSAVITIMVHSIPTIAITSTPNPVCLGSTATITASGATTYSWNTGAATAQIGVSPLANSTYTVRGVNQGCPPRTATVAVSVQALPVVTASVSAADTICAGQSVILTAGGAVSYQWSTGASGASFTDTPLITTTYIATGTDASGCTNTATVMQYVSECTGIASIQAKNSTLSVYPNPASGSFVISASENITLNIINETGQLVRTLSVNENNNYTISVSGLQSGIYFITGQGLNSSMKQKIIMQ